MMRSHESKGHLLSGVIVLATIATGLRLWGLDYAPNYDEFFHVLAARSWLSDGAMCIADCLRPYDRGAPFTLLVAGSLRLFGESFVAARLPSVVAGVLLVLAVFVWMKSAVSTRAALVTAGLCAVAPELIAWSQVSRFYALQALLVWVGCGLFYFAVVRSEARTRTRIATGLVALASLALARDLQITTLIPIAALGSWFVGWLIVHRSDVSRRTRLLIAGGTLAIVMGVLAWKFGTLEGYWEIYRYETNLIHRDQVDNVFFYHGWFSGMYSFLYALFPLAILLAVSVARRATIFLVVMFTLSLLAHSFGGFKGDRLVLYAFPFFFGIWGIALADVVPRLQQYLRSALAGWWKNRPELAKRAGPAATALVGLGLLFAALNIEALQTTIRVLTVPQSEWTREPWYRGHTDWESVEPTIQPIVESVEIVASSAVIKTLYYFGKTDVSLSATELYDHSLDDATRPEFWKDWRHGRPVISSPESVEQLVACFRSGLILVENGHWRRDAVVPDATADAIERLTSPVSLPRGVRARAFTWSSESPEHLADCPSDPVPTW